MVSEFDDAGDQLGLNMNFQKQLAAVQSMQAGAAAGHIDASRNIGVCSFSNYLRKNHIYFMYREYAKGGD